MKNILKFIRRIMIINPKFLFKPLGFLEKTRLDFEDLILKRKKFICNINKFKIKIDNVGTIGILQEIFNTKNYEKIKGNKNVLDLGGYYGESALDLSLRNKHVNTYEPEKNKFKFLKENISQRKNINGFNYAVVTDDSKEVAIYKKNEHDYSSSINKNLNNGQKEIIKCVNIKKY